MTIQSQRRRIAILIAFGIAVVGLAAIVTWRLQRAAAAIGKPTESVVDLGAVTTRIRSLNRLETASMHVVHVSTINQEYRYVPDKLVGDTLTLFAAGDVIAGVDLSQLKPGDVRREPNGTIVIRLPPPQVLVTRIDNRETRVIARQTGLLRRADPGLEGRARLYAEGGVRTEAVRRGILPLAEKNAQQRIAELLHATGVNRVVFEGPGLRTED
jgi:Protein of unknown function (DUF4230)